MQKIRNYVVPKYIYLMWLTLIVAFGLGIWSQDWPTVFISFTVLGLSLYIIWLSQRIRFKIPAALLTASIVFLYATLFLGEVHNFYERLWWWDLVLHTGSAMGFGLIGAIVLILLFRHGKVQASPILVSVFVFAFAVAIGAVWEIFEFAMDSIFGMNMQKSGLVDTMFDLIVDSIGAFLAALATFAYLKNIKWPLLSVVFDDFFKKD